MIFFREIKHGCKHALYFLIGMLLVICNIIYYPYYYQNQLEDDIHYRNCKYWDISYEYKMNTAQQIWLIMDTINQCNNQKHKKFLIMQLNNNDSVVFSRWSTIASPSKINEKALITLNNIFHMNYTAEEWIKQ